MDVRVSDDPAGDCAELLCEAASAGSHIVLTGGSTPGVAYQRAAAMGADWAGATLWFSDERCVPPDDELSNYRLAKESLLDRIDGAAPDVHRIRGERGPHAGADDYDLDLRETLGEQLPQLDLVLLGLGPDAHVASLFPGHATLGVSDRAVVGEDEAGHEPFVPRVSMTLPTLCNGRHIVFLVTGDGKADAVEKAFGREPSPEAPGSLVRPRDGRLTLLLDAAAASRLPQ
ncbi:MAG: 6-phosphogluconolactonase [Thermoleophilaceae bacterium]|jgi:6-phosphogluconolactonase|nr:6-phosphogluconolactonase [Thermoleophilaceae bacterium]